MSRFKSTLPAAALRPTAIVAPPLQTKPIATFPSAPKTFGQPPRSVGHSVAFFLLCIYLLSNLFNDFSMRFLGSRAYLSLIAGACLPIACLASQNALAGLKTRTGRWWAAFLGWMILCIPTSHWPGGSWEHFVEFSTKNWVLFFYVAATVMSFAALKVMFRVMAVGAALVLVSCALFGQNLEGRLLIPDSIFFDNSNDLALQLMIGAGFLLYLVMSGGMLSKIAGAAGLQISLLYLLRTGSRGTFVALILCVLILILLSRRRALFLGVIGIVALIAAFAASSEQLSRLVNISLSSDEAKAEDTDKDLASQQTRMTLFWKSIDFTIENPIFGVGPNQFQDTLWQQGRARGEKVDLKTHNAYTQVSSEMGFPGFFFYIATEFGALVCVYRALKLARQSPQGREYAAIALCLFVTLVGFSIASIFNHVAYTRHLPTLAGLAVVIGTLVTRDLGPGSSRRPQGPMKPVLG